MFASLQFFPFFTTRPLSQWRSSWWQWLLVTLRMQLGFYFYFCEAFFFQQQDALRIQTKIFVAKITFIISYVYFTQLQILKYIRAHVHAQSQFYTRKNTYLLANPPGIKNTSCQTLKSFSVIHNNQNWQNHAQSYCIFMHIVSGFLETEWTNNTFRRHWWIIRALRLPFSK